MRPPQFVRQCFSNWKAKKPDHKKFRYYCNMSEQLREILKLSVSERIFLVEAIWDSISEESQQTKLSPPQKEHLQKRLQMYRENPEDLLSWEEVKDSLK